MGGRHRADLADRGFRVGGDTSVGRYLNILLVVSRSVSISGGDGSENGLGQGRTDFSQIGAGRNFSSQYRVHADRAMAFAAELSWSGG